jgi:hypothetical protein
MRCPGCNGLFSFFVHGNGAVELRPVEEEPLHDEPAMGSRLPPRSAATEETAGTRTIFTSRRRKRPIGGYHPFEKSRSYIGMFAFMALLGVGSLSAYVYFNFIDTTGKAMGKRANNAMNQDLEAKRKEHQEKAKRALENLKKREELKKQSTKGQPAGAQGEDRQPPKDQTQG